MHRVRTILLALAFLAPLAACGEKSPEQRDLESKTGAAWDAARKFAASEKAQAMQAFGARMSNLAERFTKLQTEGGRLSEEAQKNLSASFEAAGKKMEGLALTTEDGWEKAMQALSEAYDTLERELTKAEGK